MPDPNWLSPQGIADYLTCSLRTVQDLTKQGRLPVSYHLGPRLPRYNTADVDRAMRKQDKDANQQPRLVG